MRLQRLQVEAVLHSPPLLFRDISSSLARPTVASVNSGKISIWKTLLIGKTYFWWFKASCTSNFDYIVFRLNQANIILFPNLASAQIEIFVKRSARNFLNFTVWALERPDANISLLDSCYFAIAVIDQSKCHNVLTAIIWCCYPMIIDDSSGTFRTSASSNLIFGLKKETNYKRHFEIWNVFVSCMFWKNIKLV